MNPGYQIDTQMETEIGFDHEHHKWSPAYLLLSGPALIDAGVGKLFVTGRTTTATLCSPDPDQIARVVERYREITGHDPLVILDRYDQIAPGVALHEKTLWARDVGDTAEKALALTRAIRERWEPEP